MIISDPSTESYGTPLVTLAQFREAPLTHVLSFSACGQLSIQIRYPPFYRAEISLNCYDVPYQKAFQQSSNTQLRNPFFLTKNVVYRSHRSSGHTLHLTFAFRTHVASHKVSRNQEFTNPVHNYNFQLLQTTPVSDTNLFYGNFLTSDTKPYSYELLKHLQRPSQSSFLHILWVHVLRWPSVHVPCS